MTKFTDGKYKYYDKIAGNFTDFFFFEIGTDDFKTINSLKTHDNKILMHHIVADYYSETEGDNRGPRIRFYGRYENNEYGLIFDYFVEQVWEDDEDEIEIINELLKKQAMKA